jgi:hypothetical protein
MINSTPSPGSTPGSNAVNLGLAQSAVRSNPPSQDRLSLDQAQVLQSALTDQPEVRPEMVERGRALAADPGYPPQSIIGQIASQIMASPDLSEDET